MQSLIYGVIELPSRMSAAETGIDRAISNLPETDQWPFLVRSLFAQTSGPGLDYGSRIVHFGASFKEIESEWAVWVEKFESMLHQINGLAAVVHLESELVGNHRLDWSARHESGACTWDFIAGPRGFD